MASGAIMRTGLAERTPGEFPGDGDRGTYASTNAWVRGEIGTDAGAGDTCPPWEWFAPDAIAICFGFISGGG
jgi:hypothetical protein